MKYKKKIIEAIKNIVFNYSNGSSELKKIP